MFVLTVMQNYAALGENRSNIGDFAPTCSLWPEISGRRGRPTIHFLTDS